MTEKLVSTDSEGLQCRLSVILEMLGNLKDRLSDRDAGRYTEDSCASWPLEDSGA